MMPTPPGSFGPICAIAFKDVLLEIRNKEIVVSVLVFSLLVLVVFNFAIGLTPQSVNVIGPGILWVAIAFAAIVGINRSFLIEKDRDALQGLMLAPVSRDALLLGKALGNFLFITAAEVMIFPIFTILFNLNVIAPEAVAIALLTNVGVATAGTVFAAMAVNTRAQEFMLPLLFLPVVAPLLVAAVEGTAAATQGGGWSACAQWLGLAAAFDAAFAAAALLVFHHVWQD